MRLTKRSTRLPWQTNNERQGGLWLCPTSLEYPLVLGAGVTWQHSEDYAPSRALIYLRYTFDPWQGNLPLPVSPLVPHADFR